MYAVMCFIANNCPCIKKHNTARSTNLHVQVYSERQHSKLYIHGLLYKTQSVVVEAHEMSAVDGDRRLKARGSRVAKTSGAARHTYTRDTGCIVHDSVL